MCIGLALMAWYQYRKDQLFTSKKKVVVDENYESPFQLMPAMKFALIIV